MTSLISAAELAAELAGERPPVLLDVRFQPMGGENQRERYLAGHLPGAVFVDLDAALAGPPGARGRHPLPDLGVFGGALRQAGVFADSPVVVYDGPLGWGAARAWWLLRWAGHSSVRVLDGGIDAWTGPLETGAVTAAAPGDFRPAPGAMPVLDADGAAKLARQGLLLDARAAERYRGEVEPIDRVGGHIPGAVSAPTTENLDQGGLLRPPAELAARFAALGATDAERVGVYCGSGVSAAQQVLALEVAGIEGVALYVGSWSEWSSDTARPVATGADPG